MTRVAILNSRQSKTPVGDDNWVKATLAAVDYAAAQGWTIASSFGLNTWELVTWAAGQRTARLELFCPDDFTEDQKADILRCFNLDAARVRWNSVSRAKEKSTVKNWWEHRDFAIVALADCLMPISVRRGGTIESLLSIWKSSVDERFRIPYSATPHHEHDSVNVDRANPELMNWSEGWLIHWTRACHGPWPGETEAEFYADMSQSGDLYCRSALRTLRRILAESRIRASSWRIGANAPAVALTELSPADSLKLIRWRPRWSRWSFEPYGVAISREAAVSLGIKPVRYVDEKEWKKLAETEKPLSHQRGKNADTWPAEREWRALGDILLNAIPTDEVRVIVKRAGEVQTISDTCGFQVQTFEVP